jgi:TPR repeat protein
MAEAVKWFRLAADQGEVYAEYSLGECYKNGYGVEQDMAEAVKWFRLAADQGLSYAQCALAFCCRNGTGVPKDPAVADKLINEAMPKLRAAAEQGDAEAQMWMGRCCEDGFGAEKDESKAVEWFRKAAGQDHADAQYSLALILKRNGAADEAETLLRNAAEFGHPEAKKLLDAPGQTDRIP